MGGRLILPGEAARTRGLTILVPRGYETGEQVLIGKCHVCDATFYRGEEEKWQKHVGWCARRNMDEIQASREEHRKRMAIFQEENWDPEVAAHMRRVGERMLREGRLVVKPSERAGFS